MNTQKLLKNYIFCSLLYGFTRKIDDMVNATTVISKWDETAKKHIDRPIPMLLTDRVVVLGISTLASPYLLPKYIYDDITLWEIYFRKANPMDYGIDTKRTMLDYLF